MGGMDNRSFLRIAHGYLLGLMHWGDGKAAKTLAKKLLAWCPADNLGVRMLLGDISMMTGDTQSAMKSYLKEATDSPAHWYQAGQIAFREGDFVSAMCVGALRPTLTLQKDSPAAQRLTSTCTGMPATAMARNGRQTTCTLPCVTGQRKRSTLLTGCLTQALCCGNAPT